MVLKEVVPGFAHLYAYGVSKCTFLAGLTGRPTHNLEDVNCPARLFQSRALVYPVLSQVSQMLLPNQNRAFPLRLLDKLYAEERFRPMTCRYDTSYCRLCCNPINRPCTSPTQSLLLLQWQLEVSGPPPPTLLRLQTDDVTGGGSALRHLYLLAC